MNFISMILSVAVLTACAFGDEIRWINPLGGDWSAPYNWDLGRAPQFGDDIIFSIDTSYSVSVGIGDACGWTSLTIDRGEVFFDLHGGSMTDYICFEPDGKIFYPPRSTVHISSAGPSPTDVVMHNGTLFGTSDTSHALLMSSGIYGADVKLKIDGLAESWHGSFDVEVRSGCELTFAGDSSGNDCHDWKIREGGAIRFLGNVSFRKCNWQDMDGRISIEGSATGNFAVRGAGHLDMEENAYARILYPAGISINMKSGATLEGEDGFEDVDIDFREATETATIRHGFLYGSYIGGSVKLGPANRAAPAVITLRGHYVDGSGFQGGTRVIYDATSIDKLGEHFKIATIRQNRSSQPGDIDFNVTKVIGGEFHIRRMPRAGSETDWFALATPPNWCAGDVNFDSRVDFFDLLRLIESFGNGEVLANINNDDRLDYFDILDFVLLLQNSCSP